MAQRTLRSKRLRDILWLATGGRCAICGQPLKDDWEADHIVPWALTGRTNVHEMQALCRQCNRRKGTMALRKHQRDLVELLLDVQTGAPMPQRIGGHIACGGGKQGFAGIAAHYAINLLHTAQKMCWVTPNGTLRRQAAESLSPSGWLASAINHNLEIYESVNSRNPSKDRSGYAITYHALVADKHGINKQEFERYPYLLILDEPHHVAVGSPFAGAVKPLVDRAAAVLYMSGTLDRSDRVSVSGLPYNKDGLVDTISRPDFRWIRYSIRDAIADHAIVPVHFHRWDGKARWYQSGVEKWVDKLGSERAALFTALRTEYAQQLLENCVEHWQSYLRINGRSQLLVVCADVKQANAILKHLKRLGIRDVEIATYKEEDADDAIKRFQEGKTAVLVTVAKAYEGLDAPAITHIACLTEIRSRPWIEQMIARAWRYDREAGPWITQRAFVWAPDDTHFQQCIQRIDDEQQEAIRQEENGPTDPRAVHGDNNQSTPERIIITPVDSAATQALKSSIGTAPGIPDTAEMEAAISIAGSLDGKYPLDTVLEIVRKHNEVTRQPTVSPVAARQTSSDAFDELRPQQRLDALKSNLASAVAAAARKMAGDNESMRGHYNMVINAELKRFYGDRKEMTESQVLSAIKQVEDEYKV